MRPLIQASSSRNFAGRQYFRCEHIVDQQNFGKRRLDGGMHLHCGNLAGKRGGSALVGWPGPAGRAVKLPRLLDDESMDRLAPLSSPLRLPISRPTPPPMARRDNSPVAAAMAPGTIMPGLRPSLALAEKDYGRAGLTGDFERGFGEQGRSARAKADQQPFGAVAGIGPDDLDPDLAPPGAGGLYGVTDAGRPALR